MPFQARATLSRVDSHLASEYETPAIISHESRFSVTLGSLDVRERMDQMPVGTWHARLRELDEVISPEHVEAIARHASDRLRALEDGQRERIASLLQDAFAARLSPGPVIEIETTLLDGIAKYRDLTFINGEQQSISLLLAALDGEIGRTWQGRELAWGLLGTGPLGSLTYWLLSASSVSARLESAAATLVLVASARLQSGRFNVGAANDEPPSPAIKALEHIQRRASRLVPKTSRTSRTLRWRFGSVGEVFCRRFSPSH